jgi:chromosome segregation ATPase
MGKITTMFSRFSANGKNFLDNKSLPQSVHNRGDFLESQLHVQDVSVFETMGENQRSIDFALANVLQGFAGFNAVFDQLAAIKVDLARSFDEQRKLALVSSALKHERDHALQRYAEKSSQYETSHSELLILRGKVDELQRNYDRAQASLEGLEHRHHMLGVAKRETEDTLSRNSIQLADALDELEARRLEVSSLQDLIEINNTRVGELTIKCTEASNSALMLSNRCETLEASLQQKIAELIEITDRFDLIYQEKEAAINYSQRNEQDAAHARAEMGRINQQFKQEKKSRDLEIQHLKSELGEARARAKTLEEVSNEAVADNERLTAANLKLEDRVKQSEVALELHENKAERQNSKVGLLVNAKAQLEQSRVTMAARLEAVTQALSDREADVKRLNGEVAMLSGQVEKQSGVSSDNIEALTAKIFELEKELSAQCNETAFYAAQLTGGKQAASRGGIG